MTHRSVLIGNISKIEVHAGGSVRLEGWDSDRVQAVTENNRGLKIERRSESEFGRARAKVGEYVLFDIRLTVPKALKKNADDDVLDVQLGDNGTVHVPRGCDVKVYAGRDIDIRGVVGQAALFAGGNLIGRDLHALAQASAGGAMDLESEMVVGGDLKFTAGRDLRWSIPRLNDVLYMIDDLGGYWEATIGTGRVKIRLKAGGDVTLVTDQPVHGEMLGKIERLSQ